MSGVALSAPSQAGAVSGETVRRRAVAIFCLAILADLLAVSDRLLQDPDSHWHKAVGEWIVAHRAFPWTDPFSHTLAGAPWIAKEWLSQLIFHGAFVAGGWWAVTTLTAAVIAGSFAWLYGWLYARLQPTAALTVALVVLVLACGHFLARPHMLVFPVLILWTTALVDVSERRGGPPWWLAGVMVLWTNLHGSYTAGLMLAGIFAAEAVFHAERGARRSALTSWGLWLAAIAAASCATPYGVSTLLLTAKMFGSGETLRYVKEWQPLPLDTEGWLAIAGLAALLGALACRPQQNAFRLITVALFGWMMLRHGRFASLFAIVAPIVATGPILRLVPGLAPGPAGEVSILQRIAILVLSVAALGAAVLKVPEPSPNVTPAAGLAAARAAGLSGPVYNDYDFGGYLIAKGEKTFIDGRTDQLFLDGFMPGLDAALKAGESRAFADLLARHSVTWALVRPGSDDRRHLDSLGWRKVHEDPVAVVFARR